MQNNNNLDYKFKEIAIDGIGKIKISRYKKTVNIVFPKPTSILNMEPKISISVAEMILKRAIEIYLINGISKDVLFTKIMKILEDVFDMTIEKK